MIWVAGWIVEDDELKVSVRDRTFEHGLGLFETLRTWNGRAPLLGRHLVRIADSARVLGIPIDPADLPDANAVAMLLEANEVQEDVALRITLTGGMNASEGSTLWMRAALLPPPLARKGAFVDLGPWMVSRHDLLAQHKMLNYWSRRLAYESARRLGYDEVLSISPCGNIWEGSRTNLFLVQGRVLITPTITGPIVPGIMRGLILELAREIFSDVIHSGDPESVITWDRLARADEVFLTNSVRGIIPVARIGEKTWPAPGDQTRRLSFLVEDWVREQGGTPP
jgi:branched-subunit amino acid aminotransferase/4-amino-4-deoxychorismate lyase